MNRTNWTKQGRRLLVFVTTSKASVMKMLEIDGDFAKKVAVPAVSNLQELANVLQESRMLNSGDVNQAISMLQERTGAQSLGLGVKTILDCIFEAKAGGPESNVAETFVDLIEEKLQEMRIE